MDWNRQLQPLCLRLNQSFVGFCLRVCQVDLYECVEFKRRRAPRRHHRRPAHRDRLTLGVNLICLYSSAKIIVNCYFQYQYDLKKRELARLGTDGRLAQELESLRLNLKLVGAPYINFPILNVCFYEYSLCLTLFCLYLVRLYFRHYVPFNVSVLRMLVDRQGEQFNYDHLIKNECDKFITSAEQYAEETDGYSRRKMARSVELLKQLSSRGHLQPFNRRHWWLDRLNIALCLLNISFTSFTAALTMTVMFFIPLTGWFGQLELASIMDYGMVLDGLLLGAVNITCVGFYFSLVVIITADQIQPVLKLNQTIEEAMARAWLLAQFQSPPGYPPHFRWTERLNSDLLLILFQFKVLRKQVQPIRHLHGFLAFIAIAVLLCGPVIWRIHIRLINQNIVALLMILCLIVAFWCDISLVPICYLQSRFEQLYRLLFSMMAHAAKCDSRGRHVYDRHTLVQLNRELAHPHWLLDQFSTKMLGTRLAWSNLLRFHFWLSVLVLSTWSNKGSTSAKSDLFHIFDTPLSKL